MVVFALDGERYEIELSAGNAAALRQALEPFVARARRISGRIPIWLGREYDQHCEAPAQAGWGDPCGSSLPVD
ncbi:histone-like nucleoid-structuring protein Lsr2 [Kitasatospora sp. NPDC056138]|uniref:Lsr2 dimerization domain-containing protein n=1 Tax=Kitasatospora sp. NPDC056138 TaxID=3345724 RepID=UPI0035DF0E3D